MELWQLRQMQALPLKVKIEKSKQRIKEWYEHWDGQVYVSFSGGKDSTVLLHLVRSMYPEVPAVFVDTGLEYPEIKEFVRSVENVEWLKPKMGFRQVIEKYGYPAVSKKVALTVHKLKHQNLSPKYRNYLLNGDERGSKGKLSDCWKILLSAPFEVHSECCNVMKKKPFKEYVKATGFHPITGEMADEGQDRQKEYLKSGCNAFHLCEPKSTPLGFWAEQDVLEYIVTFKIPYATVYGGIILKTRDGKNYRYCTGVSRTGCMFCMFGCHLEGQPNRFQRMKITHPQLYHYCMKPWSEGGLGLAEVLDYIHVPYGDYIPTLKDYEQMKIEI